MNMGVSFTEKEQYSFEDLLHIVEILRSPGGCPWDREQTHESIRTSMLEETYEAIDAINRQDDALMTEEFGDVMLQVVLHAQIAKESGRFSMDEIVDGLCKKLVVRHPHVFGEQHADNADEGLKMWDAAKRKTKGTDSQTTLLRSVPKAMPALMRAEKVQGRARRVGFDWQDLKGPLAALKSEIDELCEAIEVGNAANIEDEFGDLLFSAVNVSRFIHVDAEQALGAASDKFIDRFEVVEQLAKQAGLPMTEASEQQLDAWWSQAKAILKDRT